MIFDDFLELIEVLVGVEKVEIVFGFVLEFVFKIFCVEGGFIYMFDMLG